MIKHYDVISPDGISINRMQTYETVEEAGEALDNFVERYAAQGYYSSNHGRIPLDQLAFHCNLVTIPMTAKEIINEQVKESFEYLFEDISRLNKLENGDVTPTQTQQIEQCKTILSEILLEYVEQNTQTIV